jgi:hypothetical protein
MKNPNEFLQLVSNVLRRLWAVCEFDRSGSREAEKAVRFQLLAGESLRLAVGTTYWIGRQNHLPLIDGAA